MIGAVMLAIDCVFLVANTVKIPHGGWFPLLVALFVFALLTTWKRGRRILAIRLRAQSERFEGFVNIPLPEKIYRPVGTAIFMASDPDMIPPAMARNLKHNKVLHQRTLLLSIATRDVPRVQRADRVHLETFPNGVYRATCQFGFMETPAIVEVLEAIKLKGLDIPLEDITFFLGRETLIAARRPGGMALWREHLFSFMSRNSYRATEFFRIPANQVIEIGSQIEL
jgi:KUP system potassium uptake protein